MNSEHVKEALEILKCALICLETKWHSEKCAHNRRAIAHEIAVFNREIAVLKNFREKGA